MEAETSEPGMVPLIYDKSESGEPDTETQIDGGGENYSKGPEIQTDGSNEPEMEIQIGAVFSLASIDGNKQNETLESESFDSQRTSFTGSTVSAVSLSGSTVSAVEDDKFNSSKSDESCVTNGEISADNSMCSEHVVSETGHSSPDHHPRDSTNDYSVSPARPLSPLLKVDMSANDTTGLNESIKESLPLQSVKHSFKKTKKTVSCSENKNIITSKNFSYCYVKLFDVLKHRVVKQEVIKMAKKTETDREVTTQELKQAPKIPTRKLKKKPARLTLRKKKKKNLNKEKVPTEATSRNDAHQSDATSDQIPIRPSRKRKFNHNLFTDAVVFDSRGISNFEDHVIQKQEEEDVKGRTAPTYGFRGSRPQVARTKKKLSRIRREDMPFISVTLDAEKVNRIDKSKLDTSKKKVSIPISYLLDRKVRLYHNLLKTTSGSFRILKNRSKSSFLKYAEKAMRKARLKTDSKTADNSKSTVKTEVEEGLSKKKKKKEETSAVISLPADRRHQQMMTSDNDKGNFDTWAPLWSKKPNLSNPNSLVLPVNVKKEPGTSCFDENKNTFASDEGSVSLTGRYRKPSNKYSSFITTFDRNWHLPKMSDKTSVKLEQPYIEMDIAADAEAIVRQQRLGKVYKLSDADKNDDSVEMNNWHRRNPNIEKSPISSATVVESPTSSFQNNGQSIPVKMPSATTGNSTRKILPKDVLKPVKTNPALAMKPLPMTNTCENSSLYRSTVNELARVQNTKKFFQLRIGEKMVLIPADGGDLVPKAYVIDIAKHPFPMKTNTEKTLKGETGVLPPVSTDYVASLFKKPSNQANIKTSDEDVSGKLTVDTGDFSKQTLSSPPLLSPHVEPTSSMYSHSNHNPPVLSPKGLPSPEKTCEDAKPPILCQELGSCEGTSPNSSHMKSILPKLHQSHTPGEDSASGCPSLPASADGHPPHLTLVSDGSHSETIVVKKEPAHLRNFDVGESTKDNLPRKPNITTQTTCSISNVYNRTVPLTPNNSISSESRFSCTVNTVGGSGTATASSENSGPLSVAGYSAPSSSSGSTSQAYPKDPAWPSSSKEDEVTQKSSLDPSFAATGNILDNPQSNVGAEDPGRERDIFGIKTVTHVPANETMVQERIRKLRERLRETQADLDNVRKTFRIKKENIEDDY
ncbi:uncharacterized protein LOC117321645 [Pecten maximus]|uniref:uncharacterized protein LOC117321645 n=1 Tax=Pecten maximus TaxID=6579 RepID=UPI001457F5F5|nr:uncharacterized protein LOC117321645 [Pecten maximus]